MQSYNNSACLESREISTATKKILKGRPDYYSLTEPEQSGDNDPRYLLFNLETGCSYRCPKCALNGERDKSRGPALSADQRGLIIDRAVEMGIKSLVIAGLGEPTENFSKIREVVETAYERELTSIIFSTLNAVTSEMARFFRDRDVSLIVSLDSLNPKTYRKLTGNGDLEKILRNLTMVRQVYEDSSFPLQDNKIVRLGINTTIVNDNKEELDSIREFAADDMQFIANSPMKRGRFIKDVLWRNLIGDSYDELAGLAKEKSETGGNSTYCDGVCGYFGRGISVDTDGELMSCVYAGESVDIIQQNVLDMPADQLQTFYLEMRKKYQEFIDKLGYTPPCPVRHPEFSSFLETLRK